MQIQATPLVGVPGVVEYKITDIAPEIESIGFRFVTPVTPDNSVGFIQVNNLKLTPANRPPLGSNRALVFRPGGYPSGVLINVYAQGQSANQTQDIGMPSNAEPVICD